MSWKTYVNTFFFSSLPTIDNTKCTTIVQKDNELEGRKAKPQFCKNFEKFRNFRSQFLEIGNGE